MTNLNRWGKGTREDLILYGRILGERTLKAEKYALSTSETALKAREKRIKLPLKVCQKNEIEQEARLFLNNIKDFSSAGRLVEEWKKKAYENCDALRKKPYIENIPIQVISIGHLKIICIPGEVFCQIGLDLQKKWSSLFTFGYANGNLGYLPTKKAYQVLNDYACYSAPKFTTIFPFSPEIEGILLKESNELLEG